MSSLSANFEDVYPLTPFQQGMLFHVLDTPEAGVYLNQQKYTLRGELDLPAFKQALSRPRIPFGLPGDLKERRCFLCNRSVGPGEESAGDVRDFGASLVHH